MASFPASNAYTENGIDRGTLRQRLTDHLASTVQLVGAGTVQALTIASGSITPASGASGSIVIDTEGAASSDTLTNISTANLPDGSHILIRIADNGRVVNVLDMAGGAGQIALEGGLDLQLNLVGQWLELRREGTDWREVRRGGREKVHVVGSTGEPAYVITNESGSTAKFWKDESGIVRCIQKVASSSLSSASSNLFTLPAGYVPLTTLNFPVLTQVSAVREIGHLRVDMGGLLTWFRDGGVALSAETLTIYLDPVQFRAEA